MKKVFLFALLTVFACSTADAQFNVGKKLLNKGKEKLEQKADKLKGNSNSNNTPDVYEGNENNGAEVIIAPTNTGKGGIASNLKEPYAKVEAALATLEAAVAANNQQYFWDDPAGNDAKKALNDCLDIPRFDRKESHFVDYCERYKACREKMQEGIFSDKPANAADVFDRSKSKDQRLNAFYTLMEYYIAKADAAPYVRLKEFIVGSANVDWTNFEYEKLMLYNNTKLQSLRKKLDSYRLNLDPAKSGKLGNKNAVQDLCDNPGLIFSISDYSNNDYTNDANVSEGTKQAMKETADYHAQVLQEKADVEGLKSITIKPNGTITSKYGEFYINHFNEIYDERGRRIAHVKKDGINNVYSGRLDYRAGSYRKNADGSWTAQFGLDEAGKIQKDGTVWFYGQKIGKVDISQISPEWVCMVYFFKILESGY